MDVSNCQLQPLRSYFRIPKTNTSAVHTHSPPDAQVVPMEEFNLHLTGDIHGKFINIIVGNFLLPQL